LNPRSMLTETFPRRHGNGNSIDIHIYVRIHYEHLKYKILNLYLALPYGEN
jgi:hypothetical protein